MINQNKRIEREFNTLLKNNNIQFDDSKKALIDYFFKSEHHLSFQELREHAEEKQLHISEKTIRKIIDFLSDYGFAKRISFEDGVTRYEHLHLDEHHDHFICLRCKNIIEFHSPHLEKEQERTAKNEHFHPFWHKMEIYGLCSPCFGKSEGVPVPLSIIPSGGYVTVREIQGGDRMCRRLLDMGLTPGTKAEVVNNHMGLVALAVRGQRLGIGRGMSKRILVELAE